MELILFVAFFWIIPIAVCYSQSKKKNRYVFGWVLSGFIFGWFAAIPSLIVPPVDK